ncbi:ribose 5-phosphate isomerase B [Wolbachia endosymbiont of Pentidionis agamae]|uniref:ribose 5-phosphate isomerase B n=1 Tax=Wolbachia endosymbiont of Pentidionis agamae TaxID=3110435 RepID=UPI002FD232DD
MSRSMIPISSDHAGFDLKQILKSYLDKLGYIVQDYGCTSSKNHVDYPDYARFVIGDIMTGRTNYGVLICGSGIGMSMIANRHNSIRAALCYNVEVARSAREHNNANILCLGAKFIDNHTAKVIVESFLTTPFLEGRHRIRVDKLDLSKNEDL